MPCSKRMAAHYMKQLKIWTIQNRELTCICAEQIEAKKVGLSVDPKGNPIINSAEDYKAFEKEKNETKDSSKIKLGL